MKATTYVLMAACCLPLLMACGNRSTHTADRSQRVVGKETLAIGDEQSLTEQDVAVSRTRRGAKSRGVAASSYQASPSRATGKANRPTRLTTAETSEKTTTAGASTVDTTQPAEGQRTSNTMTETEAKPVDNKVVDKQPSDKPLAQEALQQAPVSSTPVAHAASGQEKVLVEGCVLKRTDALSAFSVVVGSFSQPESAAWLIRKLKEMGMNPYFVQNEQGMYRLITGTFNDRDDADYQVLKLDVEGVKAWVLLR